LILTKQDIYKQYFWKDLNNIQDTDILWKDEATKSTLDQFEQWWFQSDTQEVIDINDRDIEEIVEQAEQILILQWNEDYINNPFLSKLDYPLLFVLKSCCENIKNKKISNLDQSKINWLFAVLNKILVYISEGHDVSISEINDTIMSLKNLTS
jgi:hypothetical protein